MHIPLSSLAFGLPNGMEYVVILIVALLVFGRRLPSVMRSVGGSLREFKKGVSEGMPDEDEKPPVAKEQTNTAPGSVSREKSEIADAPAADDQQRSL